MTEKGLRTVYLRPVYLKTVYLDRGLSNVHLKKRSSDRCKQKLRRQHIELGYLELCLPLGKFGLS